MFGNTVNLIIHILIAANIKISLSCPSNEAPEAKVAYKSDEIHDQPAPITLDKIKFKLKQSEIFDWEDPSLTDMERKEMTKMFDAVEVMMTSRYRQPTNAQSVLSSLRVVERVVKKQLKEGQISESLAAKFNWNKLANRTRRQMPSYHYDIKTNMRMFKL